MIAISRFFLSFHCPPFNVILLSLRKTPPDHPHLSGKTSTFLDDNSISQCIYEVNTIRKFPTGGCFPCHREHPLGAWRSQPYAVRPPRCARGDFVGSLRFARDDKVLMVNLGLSGLYPGGVSGMPRRLRPAGYFLSSGSLL